MSTLNLDVLVASLKTYFVTLPATVGQIVLNGWAVERATETAVGVVERATQTEADAGTDDERYLTPLKAKTAGNGMWLQKANNLSDVASAATSFANIKQPASETVTGVVELATSAEVITGTDTTRAITPAGLQAKVATTTALGIVELATDAETQTGTDTTRAITPSNLSSRTATETRTGIAELATQAETDAGLDDARTVTPLKLRNTPPVLVQQGLVLSNGLNSDIVLNGSTGIVSISGPTGVFSLGGFTNGQTGRMLFVYNTTGQNMTIVGEDASSTAPNRLAVLGTAYTSTGNSSALFIYSGARWILVSTWS